MSSYSYTPRVNKYWKRPKPRVYECNVRDAERFYQKSYNEYLEAKEYAAKKAQDDRINSIGESTRYTIRRSNSYLDTVPDLPISSYLTSRANNDDDSGMSSFRSANVNAAEPIVSSMEDRLQRLQKLRTELGLPSDVNGPPSAKISYGLDTSMGSSSFNDLPTPEPRDRRGKTVDVSYAMSSAGARSRGVDMTSDPFSEAMSNGLEKTSRFASKYSSNVDDDSALNASSYKSKRNARAVSFSKEEPEQYTVKSSLRKDRKFETDDDDFSYKPAASRRKERNLDTDDDDFSYKPRSIRKDRKFDTDDDDYKYKPSSTRNKDDSSSFRSTRKAVTITDDVDTDEDAYLSNMKKKFPTSDEILERIKKMDSDM